MLGIIHRMYDLTPNSPVTVTDGVSVSCANVRTIYPIGSEYVRHAFIVLQDADIVVKNAEGNTLQRGTDYFTISRAMDQLYSKQYSTSVFSGIQFKATGTYTVTSFLSCGTYPRASWYNYALETLLAVINTSIPALQAAVNNFSSSLSDMTETVMQISQTVTSHGTRLTVLESNPTIIVVADHATMIALTGIKTGTTVYVVADTDGKRAEYLYDGAAFQKTSDPDWENINIDWSALLNIPTGVAALIAGTLKSVSLADMPTPVDADDSKVLAWDKTAGKYTLITVSAASGVGDVISVETSSIVGHLVGFADTLGKKIKSLSIAISDSALAGAVPRYDSSAKLPGDITGNSATASAAQSGKAWKFLPIGYEYVQRKGQAMPGTLFGGGTWSNISSEYAGRFERVEGGNAETFGNFQGQDVQPHSHPLSLYYGAASSPGKLSGGENVYVGASATGDSSGTETRPINFTVRIWRLTAY